LVVPLPLCGEMPAFKTASSDQESTN